MSMVSKAIVSVMRLPRLLLGDRGYDVDRELSKARAYNDSHPYREPRDSKASYETILVGGYPCLVMHPKPDRVDADKPRGAIIYLHGGGERDTWKPEVSFARTYGRRAGMDVYYPLYPPFSVKSAVEAAEFVYKTYLRVAEERGAENIGIVGGSYGGFLAAQLITLINRRGGEVAMPAIVILNSPFAFPQTDEDWRLASEYGKKDAFVLPSAVEFMLEGVLRADPDTPQWALYPRCMDFSGAPETYAYYTEEVCACAADAFRDAFEAAGVPERLHLHIEPGMMHCYASAPVFKESRRDFNEQIRLLRAACTDSARS